MATSRSFLVWVYQEGSYRTAAVDMHVQYGRQAEEHLSVRVPLSRIQSEDVEDFTRQALAEIIEHL